MRSWGVIRSILNSCYINNRMVHIIASIATIHDVHSPNR